MFLEKNASRTVCELDKMTVFDFDVMSSATSTPKKDSGCACGEMTSFSPFTDLSTEFSFRSSPGDTLCVKGGNACEAEADVKWNADSQCGTALLHDHSYTKPPKVSSASLDSSCDLDESLQNLFDTCELDREFLAEAKPAFRQFLDDVLDLSDVPATDDLLLYPLDQHPPCGVPTRASSVCLAGPPASPCLFTSAGSTHTTLTASSFTARRVIDTSSLMTSSSPVPLFDCSSSSSSSLCSSPFSVDVPSSVCDLRAPDCHALDSKLKDVIDFLFTDNDRNESSSAAVTTTKESEVTSFLKEMDDVTRCGGQQPLSFSDTVAEDSVWPVTVSHRIQNGACVSCSAPLKHSQGEGEGLHSPSAENASPRSVNNTNDDVKNNTDNSVTVSPVTAPSPAAHTRHDHHSSSAPSSTATSGSCLKRSAGDSGHSDSPDKRRRLGLPSGGTQVHQAASCLHPAAAAPNPTPPTSDHACVVGGDGGGPIDDVAVSPHKVPLLLDLSEDTEDRKSDRKGRDGVLDYLSFVASSKLPLSPIHHHHFGRHG